jgi:hypothetical protein
MSSWTAGIQTVLKTFLAAAIGLLIADGADVLQMNTWSSWHPYVAAGIAAVLAWAYSFLNPTDSRFGVGKASK